MEELIDAVRRDPASAFLQLGEAYLALGRPKDVLEVCNVGLNRAPEHIEGRVLLSRAHCALHQWKEAQGELLRVVKVDRANRLAFALLGEVLLRRGDVERAVPVLQHAQNLDPTSSYILSLLKRARSGEALDAPEPVPTAVLPRDVAVVQASAPTRMHHVFAEPDPPPPPAAPPKPRQAAAPPPASIEGVRPRLISANKPQNAAAAALRQSAAVGENYLNELLTGGLLDVAGVRLPDVQYDLRPDRRWGRSARRSFVFLFLLLFMGLGGGGAWYYWTEKQKTIAVARLQREAQEQVTDGSFTGLEAAVTALSTALVMDNDNPLTMAFVAEAAGLSALLYGTEVAPVERAIRGASSEISDPAEAGYRELLLGKVASKLAQVPVVEAKTTTLYEALALLDGFLKAHPDDRWAVWLQGRALQLAGERKAAIAAMKQAAAGDGGLIVAKIDLADLAADDGRLDDALAQYDAVNKQSKDHPLALLGKALARAENDVESTQAFDDLNVKLDKPLGPRVAAYRQLALAFANIKRPRSRPLQLQPRTSARLASRSAAPGLS
jgi:tetratricopeptide (TPR) repeat protein